MGNRRRARILAFQALFSWEMNKATLEELLDFSWLDDEGKEKYAEEVLLFARLLISGTVDNIKEIDELIKSHAEHWDLNRMNKVELSIMRMSVYALLYQQDIPANITINEAVEIAKEFGQPESHRFINGILDGINKKSIQKS